MINIILGIILALLQIGDGITTYKALEERTGTHEENKWLAKLYEKFGVKYVLIITKSIYILLIGFIVYLGSEVIAFTIIFAALIGYYGPLVYRNYRKVRSHPKK